MLRIGRDPSLKERCDWLKLGLMVCCFVASRPTTRNALLTERKSAVFLLLSCHQYSSHHR